MRPLRRRAAPPRPSGRCIGVTLLHLLRRPARARRSDPDHDAWPDQRRRGRGDLRPARHEPAADRPVRQLPVGAATGDLGTSIIQNAPVSELIVEKLAPTLGLLGLATLLSILIAVPLTLVAVRHRNRWPDHVIRMASMVGFAMPPFWIGLLLILGFGLTLKWFPISGFGDGPARPSAPSLPAEPDDRPLPCADPDPVAAQLDARRADRRPCRGGPRQGPLGVADPRPRTSCATR